jgi:hypothetical protein
MTDQRPSAHGAALRRSMTDTQELEARAIDHSPGMKLATCTAAMAMCHPTWLHARFGTEIGNPPLLAPTIGGCLAGGLSPVWPVARHA